MKKHLTRIFALLLAAAMIVPLASCSFGNINQNPGTTQENPGEPVITEPVVTRDSRKTNPAALDFSAFDLTYAVIVVPETGSDALDATAASLAARLEEKTGFALDVLSDLEAEDETGEAVEILVGQTNRPECQNYGTLPYDNYLIEQIGTKLVIRGGSDEAVAAAVEELFTEESFFDGETLMVPSAAYSFEVQYPVGRISLGGADILDYTIVYDSENAATANYLQKVVRNLVGYEMPMQPDFYDAKDMEIVIGGVERFASVYPEEGEYIIKQLGTKLVLGGTGTNAGYYATIDFISSYLNISKKASKLSLSVTEKTDMHSVQGLFALNLDPELFDASAVGYSLEFTAENVFKRFEADKASLPEEVTVLERLDVNDYPFSLERQYYVATDGDDENPGTKDLPVATLEQALRLVNRSGNKGGVIWMRGGTYSLDATVNIGRDLSGTATCPLFIKAYINEETKKAENVKLTTNTIWNKEVWQPIDPDSDPVAARIHTDVQDSILYADLADLELKPEDIAEITAETGAVSLYVGGQEYTTARYPNNTGDPNDLFYFTKVYEQGWVSGPGATDLYSTWVEECLNRGISTDTKIPWEVRVINAKENYKDATTYSSIYNPKAVEMAEEITSWVNTGDIWCYGSTFEGWEWRHYNLYFNESDAYSGNWHYGPNGEKLLCGIKTDAAGISITQYNAAGNSSQITGFYSLKSKTPNPLGTKHSTNSPSGHNNLYFFNAIEALDIEGEWFFDREHERIYIYPSVEFYLEDSDISYAGTEQKSAFNIVGASYVVLDGLHIEGASLYGITLQNCDSIVVQDCSVRHAYSNAVNLRENHNCAIIYNEFSRSHSASLIAISNNNDRTNVQPSNNIFQNNIFYDPSDTVQGGIGLGGVRNIVSHNYFSDTTIQGDGYANIVEYNRFDGGSKDVVDGGMVYFGGYSTRANHFRYNLFQKFKAIHNGVYNDTQGSGSYMYGNIVSTIGGTASSHKGWYSSSGRGNVCYGNIMVLRNPVQVLLSTMNESDEGNVAYEQSASSSSSYVNGNGGQISGDQINQSNLFYYYYSMSGYSMTGGNSTHYCYSYNEWAKYKALQQKVNLLGGPNFDTKLDDIRVLSPALATAVSEYSSIAVKTADEEQILGYLQQMKTIIDTNYKGGSGVRFNQSLAGHWWMDYAASRENFFLVRTNRENFVKLMPGLANYMYAIAMLNDAYATDDYLPWYFYNPAKLAYEVDENGDILYVDENGDPCDQFALGATRIRKTMDFTAPIGTGFTIPQYQYIDDNGILQTVPQEFRVITEADAIINEITGISSGTGRVTFTYEEIAAIERADRSANCCVIERNIILGGTPVLGGNNLPNGSNQLVWSMVSTNNTRGSLGYNDTVREIGNFGYYSYDDIMNDVAYCDYTITADGWAIIEDWMSDYINSSFDGDFEKYKEVFTPVLDQEVIGVTFDFNIEDYATQPPLGME